jgi:hypothetical protein
MSDTSTYVFLQGFFNGLFTVNNASSNNQSFSESFNGIVFTVNRPNGEILVNLGPQIDTTANVGMVSEKLISAGATLASQIGVQGVPWGAVPYFFQNPLRHKPTDMLIRIHFDFHIQTPWYCSDVDGTIAIFLFAFLDNSGHLQVVLDGDWWNFNGGGPFCVGAVSSGLNGAMPGVRSAVQALLPGITKAAAGIKFSRLYFLPGDGTKAAVAVENATNDLSIGLLL